MPLPPTLQNKPTAYSPSFNRSVALNAFATIVIARLPVVFFVHFQSLSRAQCLCHHNDTEGSVHHGNAFNRSVALNAFATQTITNKAVEIDHLSIAQSRTMPLPL